MEFTKEQEDKLRQAAISGCFECLALIRKQLEDWKEKKGQRVYCAFNKTLNNFVADNQHCDFGAWPNVDYAAKMTLYGAEVTCSIVRPSEGYFQPMLITEALEHQIRHYESKIKNYQNEV